MSNLWLLSSSLIIILLPLCVGLELGVSPSSINLEGNVNEKICTNFTIYSDSSQWVKISMYLSDREGRNLNDYNLNSAKKGIKFYGGGSVNAPIKREICFEGNRGGSYNGLVKFEFINGLVEVGSWVVLDINGNIFEKIERVPIMVVLLASQSMLLLVIFGLLMMSASVENSPR